MSGSSTSRELSFRLYFARESPNTSRALTNLRGLCEAAGHPNYDLKIVDVLREPKRALRDGIVLAPTFGKLAPVRLLIGDLSDGATALAALALETPER